MKNIATLLVASLALASTSFAGTQVSSSKKVIMPTQENRFRAHEWQVDAAVVGAAGTFQGTSSQSLGGNLGINYFFTQFIGIGIDNSVSGYGSPSSLSASDRLQADLLLRYPISSWNLAPYAMVGGGATWDSTSQGNGNLGLGLDYRFTSNVGLFADCRWLYGTSANGAVSTAMPRVGVRFAF